MMGGDNRCSPRKESNVNAILILVLGSAVITAAMVALVVVLVARSRNRP